MYIYNIYYVIYVYICICTYIRVPACQTVPCRATIRTHAQIIVPAVSSNVLDRAVPGHAVSPCSNCCAARA